MGNVDHTSIGLCDPCGKRTYPNRRVARRARRVLYPHEHYMSAYRCPRDGSLWHLGHRPAGRALIRWRDERAS